MRKLKQRSLMALGVIVVALVAAACGSSSSNSSSSSVSGLVTPTSGVGLTQPTTGSGSKVSGGTVYFTEGSQAPPNYIFPMYSFAVCSTTNSNQLMSMMWRGLYWYGDNYRPTVDYNKSIGQKPVYSNGGKTVTIHFNPGWKW